MRITWLVSSAVSVKDGEWYSPLASVRYRVLAPARYLQGEGHQNHFLRLDQRLDYKTVSPLLQADVVVISKVLAHGSIELAEVARRQGARIVVDLCDDHFDAPELGSAYHALCQMANRVVASTAAMAKVMLDQTRKRASIIDDPYEGPPGPPRFEPGAGATKLLWFGHPVNFDTVGEMLPKLAALSRTAPLLLHVVSNSTGNGIRPVLDEANRKYSPGLRSSFTEWSPLATWRALAECDLVVVPSLPAAKKMVKSPNRVVEPLRAGRFVAAYPLPSYRELGEFIWLGENVADGVQWALSNAAEIRRRIAAGQTCIERRFSPLAIGRGWEAVLLQTVECERQAA